MYKKPYPIFISLILVLGEDTFDLKKYLNYTISKLENLVVDYEIIIVDNTSNDSSFKILRELTAKDGLPNLQVYRLANRVDDHFARWVGFENSIGDYIVCIELNNYDETLLDQIFYNLLEGNEIILVKEFSKTHFTRSNFIYKLLAYLMSLITNIDIHTYSSKYLGLSRRVVNYVLQFENPELRLRNISSISGFKKTSIILKTINSKRKKLNLIKSISRGSFLMTLSTFLPLRVATLLASAGAIISFIYSLYIIAVWLLNEKVVPGWVSLSMQISIMFFLNSLVLLIMSEYILSVSRRFNSGPKYYIIEELTSFEMRIKDELNISKNE